MQNYASRISLFSMSLSLQDFKKGLSVWLLMKPMLLKNGMITVYHNLHSVIFYLTYVLSHNGTVHLQYCLHTVLCIESTGIYTGQ